MLSINTEKVGANNGLIMTRVYKVYNYINCKLL